MNRVRRKIIQLHKICRRKRDDRGSAIVIVIIAMAMIGILATTLLWMSYMNYMIKVADVRNKNSFYSAEEVVEQIMAGLRQTSAEAVGVAYRDVMANWEDLGSEENRYNIFATTYMDTLVDLLKDSSRGSGYYDRKKLKAYVDKDVFDGAAGEPDYVGVDVNSWDNGAPAGESMKQPEMEMVNNNSIILHNIYVSYTDSENRVSIVQTDVCMDVPKLIFESGGTIDGLYEYTLIGNSGIDVTGGVTGGGGTTTVEGSIYAGTNETDGGGLNVYPANTLALDGSRRVISKGDIVVEGPAASLVVRDMPGEDNRVYARNIILNSGTVSLDSKTYVANDLSLNGSGSKATLSKEYYGYGSSTHNGLEPKSAEEKSLVDSAASSAIIINGRNSTVDMAGVNRLLLAGRSYIGRASTRTEADEIKAGTRATGDPVMMGESIAVKGGQIAYLVPAECIGTMGGETIIGQNPVSGDKISDMEEMLQSDKVGNEGASGEGNNPDGTGEVDTSGKQDGQTFHEVDFDKKVYRLGGMSLSQFGVIDKAKDVNGVEHIRRVNVQYQGKTLRYYYLVMDEDNAEKYFVQYYNFHANRESIDRYFNTYASGGILLGDFDAPDNQYTILGNSLVSSALTDSGVTLLTRVDQSTINPGEGGEGGTPGEGGDGQTPGEGGDGTQNPPIDPDAYTETGENANEVDKDKQIDEAVVINLSAGIANTYKALTFNLTEDASTVPTDPEVAKNYYVFNSIIKETEVKEYLDDHGKNTVVYETDSGLQAILTREPLNVSAVDAKTRLIISYGDVNVDHNFTGLIIAKGKITVDPSAAVSIKQNKMDLYKVLEAKSEIEGDGITPIDMFMNGNGSMQNGAEAPEVDDAGNLIIDYGEIVRYMNWIKK